MGMMQCDLHGVQPAVYCCAHVKEARLARRPQAIVAVRGPGGFPGLLCPECAGGVNLLDPSVVSGDDVGAFLLASAEIDCIACQDGWLAELGMPIALDERMFIQ